MESKNFLIPVILEGELITPKNRFVGDENITRRFDLFFGVCKPEDSQKAKQAIFREIQEYNDAGLLMIDVIHNWDFTHNTSIDSKRWFIEDGLMCYENTAATPETSIVLTDNPTGWERVYWFAGKI
jgi:hypothetical protein